MEFLKLNITSPGIIRRNRLIGTTVALASLAVACSTQPGPDGDPSPQSGGSSNLGTGGNASGGAGMSTGGTGTSSGGTGTSAGGSADTGSGGSTTGASGGSTNNGSGGMSNGGGNDGPFSECRFHFGATRDFAVNNAGIRNEIDYFTPGWMGLSNTFDQQYVCEDVNGVLAGKVPVVVAYVSAFYAKREQNLHDCNVGEPHLCAHGAKVIKENVATITNIYKSYAQGYANCLGDSPIIFEMEPDWYQYTLSEQTNPMTATESGQIMAGFVNAMKEHLPNAYFSMDISPWVPPSNGGDQGAQWYANFDMTMFEFINTSGGGTEADNVKIRSPNDMTWAGVHGVTGKMILADTGYGVNGASEGHDDAWDNPQHINARIANGVLGVAQYNPKSDWGTTIAQIRGQLQKPSSCP